MGGDECSVGEFVPGDLGHSLRGATGEAGLETKDRKHIPYSACGEEGADRYKAREHESLCAAIAPGTVCSSRGKYLLE